MTKGEEIWHSMRAYNKDVLSDAEVDRLFFKWGSDFDKMKTLFLDYLRWRQNLPWKQTNQYLGGNK